MARFKNAVIGLLELNRRSLYLAPSRSNAYGLLSPYGSENLDITVAQYRSKKPSWLASAIDEMIHVSNKDVCPDVHEGIYL